jgi:hypothetical protein
MRIVVFYAAKHARECATDHGVLDDLRAQPYRFRRPTDVPEDQKNWSAAHKNFSILANRSKALEIHKPDRCLMAEVSTRGAHDL